MAAPEHRTAGVMGGLGPAATLYFFAKVLAATPAARDQDHIRLLIDNNPLVTCRNAALAGSGPSPGPELAAMAAGLERAGADFLIMVCNTAHAWEADIRAATKLPFVSIVEETAAAVRRLKPDLRAVGLMAAAGCRDAGLYNRVFEADGVHLLEPDRDAFMTLIGRIKAGDTSPGVRAAMHGLAERLVDAGAELILAGCTEVPIVLAPGDLSVPLVSSTDVLVERTIAYARGEPLPRWTSPQAVV